MLALDTNVLARYYYQHPGEADETKAQRDAARHLIEGGSPLFVAKTVVLELEWILRGVYERPAVDIAGALEHLLSLPHVECEDRDSVERAVANLRAGFDFADALHHASSRQCSAFLTFDARRFARKARRLALTPPVRIPG